MCTAIVRVLTLKTVFLGHSSSFTSSQCFVIRSKISAFHLMGPFNYAKTSGQLSYSPHCDIFWILFLTVTRVSEPIRYTCRYVNGCERSHCVGQQVLSTLCETMVVFEEMNRNDTIHSLSKLFVARFDDFAQTDDQHPLPEFTMTY